MDCGHTAAHTAACFDTIVRNGEGALGEMSLTIRLLGRPTIQGHDDGAGRLVRGHLSWAVLAKILLSPRPLSRLDLASELFAETADPLGSVRWCLASLRSAIGRQAFSGDPIQPNLPPGTQVDVWDIEGAEFDAEQAGSLLEGVEPRLGESFATWLLIERERLANMIDERIRQDTMIAIASGDYGRAISLAERGVRRRPFEESCHILLTKSLVLGGRLETAQAHVTATERAFLTELGEKPSPALRSAARQTVASAPFGVAPRAVAESLIKSGVAALSAGAVDAGLDCLRRAAADAEALKDRHLTARSLIELGTALIHSVRGYDDEGAVLLRQAVELAGQCGDQATASRGLCELGYAEAMAGRRPAAAGLLHSALASAGEDRGRLAAIHGFIAFNLVDWGRIEEGLAHYEVSLDHARTAGNRRREIWSLGLGCWGHLAANDPATAATWSKTCLESCDDITWLAFRPWPLTVLAEAELRLGGDPIFLRAGLEDAYALSCQLADPCWEAAVARAMALTYAAANAFEPAMQWLVTARNKCVRVTDPYAALLVEILADQVKLNFKAGKQAAARAIARDLISVAAKTHADAHLTNALAMIGGAPTRDGRQARLSHAEVSGPVSAP
jgi:DNA-binding SARP family transcriptional activator